MNQEILNGCVAASFAGTMHFGEVVKKLGAAGVEWYSSNLLVGTSTHYFADGTYHHTRWTEWTAPKTADAFDDNKVAAAIRSIQQRQILYPEFLRQIAEAGVVYYTVHLRGRKAIYFGRHGDFHIEPFP
jgi:uncharacterized protein YbcV (DUF1398 family)